MGKKTGGQAPQQERKQRKPFVELVESADLSTENEPLIAIRLTENPSPEERSLFFSFVDQLAEKLKLIEPTKVFATREIQILFDRSISLIALKPFIEALKRLLFPHREDDITINNRIVPLMSPLAT